MTALSLHSVSGKKKKKKKTHTPGAADSDGAALVRARRRKERTYPQLVHPRARARFVVIAGKVARRWSDETRRFIGLLARAGARNETKLMRRRVEQAWRLRWWTMMVWRSKTSNQL